MLMMMIIYMILFQFFGSFCVCISATLKPTLKYISPKDAIDEYKLPTTTTPLSETTTPVAKSTGTDQEVVVTTDLYRRPTQSAGPTENSSATMSTGTS